MTARMTIRRSGSKYVIRSRDSGVQAVFFGWADNHENPEFYGKQVGGWEGDLSDWEWRLTKAQVEWLMILIGVGFAEGSYEDADEERDHRYVLRRLLRSRSRR